MARNYVSSLSVEVLGDETAPGRNSVSSLFVEVLGDEVADAANLPIKIGDAQIKAIYLGEAQLTDVGELGLDTQQINPQP